MRDRGRRVNWWEREVASFPSQPRAVDCERVGGWLPSLLHPPYQPTTRGTTTTELVTYSSKPCPLYRLEFL